jgi:hypothetical protein
VQRARSNSEGGKNRNRPLPNPPNKPPKEGPAQVMAILNLCSKTGNSEGGKNRNRPLPNPPNKPPKEGPAQVHNGDLQDNWAVLYPVPVYVH